MKARAVVALAAVIAAGVGAPEQIRAQSMTPAPARGTLLTDTLWSQALGARKGLVVYLPPSYASNASRRYPVAYYLHGAGGDENNWSQQGRIGAVMDSLVAAGMPEMIVAMPDGDYYSFYTTYNVLVDAAGCRRHLAAAGVAAAVIERDCVAWPHYDDYVAFDVVKHIDSKYRTRAVREARALAGLSMGGYGAITLALAYPQLFVAAASHSGVLSPLELAPGAMGAGHVARPAGDSAAYRRLHERWDPILRPIFGADSASWFARDPARMAARLAASGKPMPALFADAGTEDVYTAESRAFRDAMAAQRIPLTYREWPGGHSWDYWRAHVGESLTWIARQIGTTGAMPPGR